MSEALEALERIERMYWHAEHLMPLTATIRAALRQPSTADMVAPKGHEPTKNGESVPLMVHCSHCGSFEPVGQSQIDSLASTAEAQALKRAARYLRKNTPADESSIKDLIEAAEHIEKHGEWPADRIEEYETKRIREEG